MNYSKSFTLLLNRLPSPPFSSFLLILIIRAPPLSAVSASCHPPRRWLRLFTDHLSSLFPRPDPLRLFPAPWDRPLFSLAPPPPPPSALSASPCLPLSSFRVFPTPLRLTLSLRLFPPPFRRVVRTPSPSRDAASASQFPLPPHPSSRLSLPACPGHAAILCEFLTAARAGQPGHRGRADRQDSRPVSLSLKSFFLNPPRSLSSFPLPHRLLHRARPALITPNHPPVFVYPGCPIPGPAGVCGGVGGSRPNEGPLPVSEWPQERAAKKAGGERPAEA